MACVVYGLSSPWVELAMAVISMALAGHGMH